MFSRPSFVSSAGSKATDVDVPALRITELTKYYGPVIGVEALSLDVPAGSVFGFLGANGAGKTTTIRLLLDLLRPTSGSASILGFDCQRQSLEVRRRVGYLPSEMPFYAEPTGAAYLRFLSALGGQPVSSARLDAPVPALRHERPRPGPAHARLLARHEAQSRAGAGADDRCAGPRSSTSRRPVSIR